MLVVPDTYRHVAVRRLDNQHQVVVSVFPFELADTAERQPLLELRHQILVRPALIIVADAVNDDDADLFVRMGQRAPPRPA